MGICPSLDVHNCITYFTTSRIPVHLRVVCVSNKTRARTLGLQTTEISNGFNQTWHDKWNIRHLGSELSELRRTK